MARAPEFRQQIIELVRSGRSLRSLAREYGVSEQGIRNWVRQAERNRHPRSPALTAVEREELRRLRRENRQLKVEREILKKAAAWFARETGAIPDEDSRS
jgi:transposase